MMHLAVKPHFARGKAGEYRELPQRTRAIQQPRMFVRHQGLKLAHRARFWQLNVLHVVAEINVCRWLPARVRQAKSRVLNHMGEQRCQVQPLLQMCDDRLWKSAL